MKIMGKKPRRRRSFTPEFKAEIVELWQRGTAGQLARDFDQAEATLKERVKEAERDGRIRRDSCQCRAPGAVGGPAGEPAAPRGSQDPEAAHGFLC